jgi:hypothetical protein
MLPPDRRKPASRNSLPVDPFQPAFVPFGVSMRLDPFAFPGHDTMVRLHFLRVWQLSRIKVELSGNFRFPLNRRFANNRLKTTRKHRFCQKSMFSWETCTGLNPSNKSGNIFRAGGSRTRDLLVPNHTPHLIPFNYIQFIIHIIETNINIQSCSIPPVDLWGDLRRR